MNHQNPDFTTIRNQFSAINQKVNNHPLIYLDSAATSLKPDRVVDRLSHFYKWEAANVHRGAHSLSDRATDLFEAARKNIARFINANSSNEIVFTRGTTESLNLVANGLSSLLSDGDEIIITDIEHHANIVPWQIVAPRKNLVIKVVVAETDGTLTIEHLKKVFSPRSKILSLTHCSNHLGNIIDIKPLIEWAHKQGLLVVIDGAQAIGKWKVDVTELNADFYAFSGHKMFAPFGIGVLYGKSTLLKRLPPYQGGGSMISEVRFEGTTFNDVPYRFEAGTPNVGGAIALSEAIDFINSIGFEAIESYESALVERAYNQLSQIEGLKILGPTMENRIPLFSFTIDKLHHSDIGYILNQQGLAVRTGHHCTQPLLKKLGISGSVRASFSIYNTFNDIDALVQGLKKAKDLLS